MARGKPHKGASRSSSLGAQIGLGRGRQNERDTVMVKDPLIDFEEVVVQYDSAEWEPAKWEPILGFASVPLSKIGTRLLGFCRPTKRVLYAPEG